MLDEDRYEGDARDWLDGVDVPPPRLQVAQIVQIGRTQVRRRRVLTAGSAVAVLAAVPATASMLLSGGTSQPPAAGPPLATLDCEVAALRLPEPGGSTDITVDHMDPTGRYWLGAERQGDRTRLILWEDGDPAVLPEPLGHDYSEPGEVNLDGVVVGTSYDPHGRAHGWFYQDGEVIELDPPAGYRDASARAINGAGDVVGAAWHGDRQVGMVWPADRRDQPFALDAPTFDDASASAITDDGRVLGGASAWVRLDFTIVDENGTSTATTIPGDDGYTWVSHPYLWTADRVGRQLPAPPGASGTDVTAARGDWAVGTAGQEPPPQTASPAPPPDTELGPVRWNLRTGAVELLGTAGPRYEWASAVNAAGDVLLAPEPITGDHVVDNPPNELLTPVLIRDGEAFLLPEPVAAGAVARRDPSEGVTTSPVGISDSGEVIVGNAEYYRGGTVPVIWHC